MDRILSIAGMKSCGLASPIVLILTFFLLLPIGMITVGSFWGATEYSIYQAFEFDNCRFPFGSAVVLNVFFKTFVFAAITWAFTLVIGFTVAYFLTLHIRTLTSQIALFLLCAIPFWT
jgi:putative spermidine/putrescine transport system permease protein